MNTDNKNRKYENFTAKKNRNQPQFICRIKNLRSTTDRHNKRCDHFGIPFREDNQRPDMLHDTDEGPKIDRKETTVPEHQQIRTAEEEKA